MKDKRYTIEKEFCGYKDARYVVRFCNEFLGSFNNKRSADCFAAGHNKHRQEAL